MIFGGVRQERLQLNEDTLWSGVPGEWNNPQAKEVLPEVRAAVAEEDRVNWPCELWNWRCYRCR